MKKLIFVAIVLIIIITLGLPFLLNLITGPEPQAGHMKVRLYHHETGEIEEMDLNNYITGVVAAEMPAAFPAEALKAQAVAARTYVLKRILAGGVVNSEHPEADLCDDPRHAQAWIPREEMKKRWGIINFYRHYYKIRQAVDATGNTVISLEGELIDPVYHAACGGKTEDAGNVWKYDIPYLQSVNCPYENYPRRVERVTFTPQTVQKALGIDLTAVPVSTGESPVKTVERTPTGRVKTVEVGDVVLPATLVRQRLGLRSTNFGCTLENGKLVFTTVGYGHGVGMCQYGAKGLAEHGYGYEEILKHYYTGVTVKELDTLFSS